MSDGIWRYLFAPVYYDMTDKNRETRAPGGGVRVTSLMVQAGTLLPVFTSVESAQDFAEAYYAEEDPVRPKILPVNAFFLERMVEVLEEIGGKALVFDPTAASVGQLTHPQATTSLRYYRRFAAELDAGLEKLFGEANARLGYGSDGPQGEAFLTKEEKAWLMDWCWARVDGIVGDAHARASEWETGAEPN